MRHISPDETTPYPYTRVELKPGITLDVPQLYTDRKKYDYYYQYRTLNSDGTFNPLVSSSLIITIGSEKNAIRENRFMDGLKVKNLENYLFNQIFHRTPQPIKKVSNYNWLLQKDAAGAFYTVTDQQNQVGMYYKGDIGNDEVGYYHLELYVLQPENGALSPELFLNMLKSLRIEGKNSPENLTHCIVFPIDLTKKK